MDLAEIERQIEETKRNLIKWRKVAKQFGIPDDISEQQTNFYLETLQKLVELKEEIK